MQRSAVVVVADKTSLKRPFIFANSVHMVGNLNVFFAMLSKPRGLFDLFIGLSNSFVVVFSFRSI